MSKALLAIALTISLVSVRPIQADGAIIIAKILVIVDYFSCSVNIFWGCDDSGSGSVAATPCQSAANVCGMTNSGNKLADGSCDATVPADSLCTPCTSDPNMCGMTNSGWLVSGVCNAVKPTDGMCTPTEITPFAASPRAINSGKKSRLSWDMQYTDSCTLTWPGNSMTFGPTGSYETPPLFTTTVFKLDCVSDASDPASVRASFETRVIVAPNLSEF